MLEMDVLPDFPRTKTELLRFVHRRIRSLEKELHPILSQIKSYVQHEGTTIQFEQVDFGKKTQAAESQSVLVEIRHDEVPTLMGPALETKLRHLAEQMGALKMKILFQRIEEAAEQTGQTLNAQGKPLDARMLLDMIDMGEVGFDKAGQPTGSFIVHPNMIPALKRASEEVENDPELKRKLESIRNRQRQQWLDRENRRKLVD